MRQAGRQGGKNDKSATQILQSMDTNAPTVSSGERGGGGGGGGVNISLFSKQGACDMALGVIDDWRWSGGELREI